MSGWLSDCLYACMYVCMSVSMNVCMRVSMHAGMYVEDGDDAEEDDGVEEAEFTMLSVVVCIAMPMAMLRMMRMRMVMMMPVSTHTHDLLCRDARCLLVIDVKDWVMMRNMMTVLLVTTITLLMVVTTCSMVIVGIRLTMLRCEHVPCWWRRDMANVTMMSSLHRCYYVGHTDEYDVFGRCTTMMM